MRKSLLKKKELQRMYLVELKSAPRIASICGVSKNHIYGLLEKFHIPIRRQGTTGYENMSQKEIEYRFSALYQKRCRAIGKDGRQCRNFVDGEGYYCRVHKN